MNKFDSSVTKIILAMAMEYILGSILPTVLVAMVADRASVFLLKEPGQVSRRRAVIPFTLVRQRDVFLLLNFLERCAAEIFRHPLHLALVEYLYLNHCFEYYAHQVRILILKIKYVLSHIKWPFSALVHI